MRRAPQYLTYFFIVISVQRVAEYIASSLHVAWMGWPFAFGIAFGVYVGMWYRGEAQTEKAARNAAWMFILVDLVFNEFELISELSATQLVPPTSNFLGIGQAYLTYGMQISALLFGAIPTLAIAFLGRLQNAADGYWKGKITNVQRVKNSLTKMFSEFTGAIAIKFEGYASGFIKNAQSQGTSVPVVDGQVVTPATPKRWKQLTADDVSYISANGRGQVMAHFGISDGAAGNWKADIAAGKRPWKSAKLPANVP